MMIMNDKQVMIWKAAAMACLMYYPDIHLKWKENYRKSSLRTPGDMAEIWDRYIQNTSLEHHYYQTCSVLLILLTVFIPRFINIVSIFVLYKLC
jgi:hypothetical protein